MREICKSGSEGGGIEYNRSSLPLYISPGQSVAAIAAAPPLYVEKTSQSCIKEAIFPAGRPALWKVVFGRSLALWFQETETQQDRRRRC